MTSQALQNVNLLRQLPDNLLVTANGSVVPRTLADLLQNASFRNAIYVINYGWIGDGTLHTVAEWIGTNPVTAPPFGGSYANLAAVQVDFPHVTSTNDSIDWAAAQLAFNRIGDVYGRFVYFPDSEAVINRTLILGNGSISARSTIFEFTVQWGDSFAAVLHKQIDQSDPSPNTGVRFKASAALDPMFQFAGPMSSVTFAGALVLDCANIALFGIDCRSVNSFQYEYIGAFNWRREGIVFDTVDTNAVNGSPHGINSSNILGKQTASFSSSADLYPKCALRLDGYGGIAGVGTNTTVSSWGIIRLGFPQSGGVGLWLGFTDNIIIDSMTNTSYGQPNDILFNGSSASVVSIANNTITSVAHGFANNDRVRYSDGGGTAIGGLTDELGYYVEVIDADTIGLRLQANGSRIDLTSLGVGSSHTITNIVAGVKLQGVSLPFPAPVNVHITLAAIGNEAEIDLDDNAGAPGVVYIHNYSLDDVADVPYGNVLNHVGLRLHSTNLPTLNGTFKGAYAFNRVDATSTFTGGLRLNSGGVVAIGGGSDATLIASISKAPGDYMHFQSVGGFNWQPLAASPSDAWAMRLTDTGRLGIANNAPSVDLEIGPEFNSGTPIRTGNRELRVSAWTGAPKIRLNRQGVNSLILEVDATGDALISNGSGLLATWNNTGINLAAGDVYKIDGTQVVGAQGAVVADAAGGVTVDTEARAAINTLLARLRTHGLIAT